MTPNFKKFLLQGLVISLITIFTVVIGGCTAKPSAAPPSSTPAPVTTPQGQAGSRAAPGSTPSSQVATPPPAVPLPTSPPGSTTSPSISTSIPGFSPTGGPAIVGASPIILIALPIDVSIVPAGDVTVSTIVSNFNLVDKTGQANNAGEGHIIYYLDVTPPRLPGNSALTSGGTCAASAALSYTWHNVGVGYHRFFVELVNNDNTPLTPAITTGVYVTAQANAPTISYPSSYTAPATLP